VVVLRTRLTREEHQLLGAAPVGVDVDDELQPRLLEAVEAEVGHLDLPALGLGEGDAHGVEGRGGALACGRDGVR
jgi:hypothetical protein